MISEWLKVMLGEIDRKRAQAEQARLEEERRERERLDAASRPRSDADRAAETGRDDMLE